MAAARASNTNIINYNSLLTEATVFLSNSILSRNKWLVLHTRAKFLYEFLAYFRKQVTREIIFFWSYHFL